MWEIEKNSTLKLPIAALLSLKCLLQLQLMFSSHESFGWHCLESWILNFGMLVTDYTKLVMLIEEMVHLFRLLCVWEVKIWDINRKRYLLLSLFVTLQKMQEPPGHCITHICWNCFLPHKQATSLTLPWLSRSPGILSKSPELKKLLRLTLMEK